MHKRTYPTAGLRWVTFGLFSILHVVAGCASDDSGEDNVYTAPPGNGGLSADASAVTTTDAGATTAPPGTGTGSTPPSTGTLKPAEAGVPAVDSGTPVAVDAGNTASDGSVPDGAAPDAGMGARPDQGMGDGKDVVCIGDSWMHLSGMSGIQDSLLKASKRPFRVFGVPGTLLLQDSVSGPAIPSQYQDAKKGGPIKTVIMTAGGNDVLQDLTLGPANILGPGCSDEIFNDACKKRIDDVAAGLGKLWAEMAKDGVQDVLIVSYSNKTLGGDFKKVSAYSAEKIAPICNSVAPPLRCSSFDTDMNVPNFKDRGDSIHPDDPTYDLIGEGVWKTMQERGMRR